MFSTSESTAKLDESLAKAQGEIQVALKDKINPHFRSKYADLASIMEACRPALSKHGISVTQWLSHADDGRLYVVTRVAHSGEWMKGVFSIPVGKSDAHGYGSAATYARRFALVAALGIVSDEDDDGNEASQPARIAPETKKEAKPAPKAQVETKKPTEAQPGVWAPGREESDQLGKLIKSREPHWSTEQVKDAMTRIFKKEKLSQFSKEEYQTLLATVANFTGETVLSGGAK